MPHYCDTPWGESLEEDLSSKLGIESLSVFLSGMPHPVFPHHDDGRAGYVDQLGEFGLRVSVSVSPIFESLLAGRLCPDKAVADWGMPAVAFYCVEESRVRVLGYCDFFTFDGDGEWGRCHGFLLPFVRCCEVKEFLHVILSFFGECPSPAWSFSGACSVPVDTVGVSCSFEFDHAAS